MDNHLAPVNSTPTTTSWADPSEEQISASVAAAMGGGLVAVVDIVALAVLNDRLGHQFGDVIIEAVERRLPAGTASFGGCWVVGGGSFGDGDPLAWAGQLAMAAAVDPVANATFAATDPMPPWAPTGLRVGDPVYVGVRVSVATDPEGVDAARHLAGLAGWTFFGQHAFPRPACSTCTASLRSLGVAATPAAALRWWMCPSCRSAWVGAPDQPLAPAPAWEAPCGPGRQTQPSATRPASPST